MYQYITILIYFQIKCINIQIRMLKWLKSKMQIIIKLKYRKKMITYEEYNEMLMIKNKSGKFFDDAIQISQ